jgi:hypothetical protein
MCMWFCINHKTLAHGTHTYLQSMHERPEVLPIINSHTQCGGKRFTHK